MLVLILLVSLAVVFGFLNGVHDSSNVVATVISSRALAPRTALAMTAVAEFCGPFLFGVAVATAVGKDLVIPGVLDIRTVLAALVGAIFWNIFTWWRGIPSSSSHALVGGIIGAVAVGNGFQAIQAPGLIRVMVALFISPILGFGTGYLFTRLVFWLARGASPRINWFFRRGQILTALALALSHSANDAQKTMGVIAMGLVATGYLSQFAVPFWVVVVGAGTMALGTATGGWRLIRTLGAKFYKIRPVHGFSAQLTSATVILGMALVGGPVSTTQVVSSAILGVGSAERVNKIRWNVARSILTAWLLTIPSTALVSALLTWLFRQVI